MGTNQCVKSDVDVRITTNDNAERFHRFEFGPTFNALEYKNLVVITRGDDLVTMEEVRDAYIHHVLAVCKGNKVEAASKLGIGRTSLYRYVQAFR